MPAACLSFSVPAENISRLNGLIVIIAKQHSNITPSKYSFISSQLS